MVPGARERRIAVLWLVAAAACGGGDSRSSLDVVIAAVEPACVGNASATEITLHGAMPVKPQVSVSGSSASSIDTAYRAWLGELELADVRWVDATTLAATVPAGLAPGVYALTIESPFASRSVLQGFQVAGASCDAARTVLAVEATATPDRVSAGDRVVVSAVVHNAGAVAAKAVTTSVTPPVGFTPFTSPTDALDLEPAQSRTFTWTFTAVAGSGAFEVAASGVDAASGERVVAVAATSNEVVVETPPGIQSYAVGGTIAGLSGSGLVLALNDGYGLAIPAGATSFTFPTTLATGASYRVSVTTQPAQPAQTCTVEGGTGTVPGRNVTSVRVTCVTMRFTVGGAVAGLAGSGLVLQLNGGNDLHVAAGAASYAFPALASGTAYTVSVRTQPSGPSQTCVVANGSGTVVAANVTDVAVTCTTNSFDVGGSVAGLAGSGLVLQLNGGRDLPIASSGGFVFPDVLSGTPYAVTVLAQPRTPSQACTVASGSGTVGSADVTGIAVTCVTLSFRIGGTLTGLVEGNKIGLELSFGAAISSLTLTQDGSFTFDRAVPSGTPWRVVVKSQPRRQTCTVANGSGTVDDRDVAAVEVNCAVSQ